MKLEEVAKIIVGQIMTRVSAENRNEDEENGEIFHSTNVKNRFL